jgi:2-amino-4-hydroxy-6-hydroxymethyldihydropteridine diphosphokinase
MTDQPYFLNQVVEIETAHSPRKLLDHLLGIELEMGRKLTIKWEPRLIDLDILFFSDMIIKEEGLEIPHPHLHERRFTLVPLDEILPDFVHPIFGKSVKELLSVVPDELKVTTTDTASHTINRI